MDKNDSSCWGDLPTDALVEILAWLPANARRRFRIVCRHWRELIDQSTATDMQRRTKIIAVAEKGFASIIIDLLTLGSATNGLWQQTDIATAKQYNLMSIVGTCNGLVCLCDDGTPGGAITVANPSTGEALRLPPLPMTSAAAHLSSGSIFSGRSWHHQYSFAYYQTTTTGPRYKVVHVPRHFDPFWQPDVVHVFTLGEASWRDVRAGSDPMRLLSSNLADVDGTVYWLTEDTGRIMSFDVRHERVTPLEVPTAMPSIYRRLAKVHGRLGVTVAADDSLTVWVMEERERWSRRYILEVDMLRQQKKMMMRWDLVLPHLVHGNYFLTLSRESWSGYFVLYRHTMDETLRSHDGVVRITHKDQGEEVTGFSSFIHQIFSYVENKETLSSVYDAVLVHK